MARDHIAVTVVGPQDVRTRIITAVAQFKGCEVSVGVADSLCLHERQLEVCSFWPTLEYLEERFPYPPVYPDTPLRRALVRSLVEQLLLRPNEILRSLEVNALPQFLLSDTPLLIDFAAAALAPSTPFWDRLRVRLERSYYQPETADEEEEDHGSAHPAPA